MQMISKLSQQMYRYRLEYVKDEACLLYTSRCV